MLFESRTSSQNATPQRIQAASDDPCRGTARSEITTVTQLLDGLRNLLHEDRQAAVAILADLTRRLNETDGAAMAGCGGLASWQVRRLTRYVEDELDGPLPQRVLAAQVRLSTSHFARAFKSSFGRTSHAYVTERRVARAKDLMLGSEKPLCEIALLCGLSDQAQLSRLFRRVVGATPLSWRRANLMASHEAGPEPEMMHPATPARLARNAALHTKV